MKRLPADVLLDRRVEAIIADGYPLPRWGWPTPATYNGATGAERIYVWQKNNIAWRQGWLPRGVTCSVCRKRDAEQSHGELYFRPFALKPVCRSCHSRIHRRFGNPDRWSAFCNALTPENWARVLLTEQIKRVDAIRLAGEHDWLAALAEYGHDKRSTVRTA